jgi:hypothetical protein
VFVIVLVLLSLRISRYWESVESISASAYKRAREELGLLKAALAGRAWPIRMCMLPSHWRVFSLTGIMKFHQMRRRFIAANSLSADFSFA